MDLAEENAALKEELRVKQAAFMSGKRGRMFKGRKKSEKHNAAVTDEIAAAKDDREAAQTKDAIFLRTFQAAVDDPAPSHPHHVACKEVGWSSTDFIKRLRDSKTFLKKYSFILRPPPPLEGLNGGWVTSYDCAIRGEKDGKPGLIAMFNKAMDERLGPKRVGRPEKDNGNGSSPGLAPVDDEAVLNKMFEEMTG